MDNDALKNEFLVESFENLSSINEDLTHLEKNPGDKDLLNKLYRTVHTMKGSASFLGYKKLQDITHHGENLLDELREGNINISSEIVDTLLETFDLCHALLKNIETGNEEGDVDTSANQAKLETHMNQSSAVENTSTETSTDENILEGMSALLGKESSSEKEDELEALVEAHREVTPPSATEVASEEIGGLSAAALESLEEMIADGKLDQATMDELKADASAPEKVSDQPPTAADDGVSSAAMDSLKELIAEGKIDSSALEEIQQEDIKPTATEVEPTTVDVVIHGEEAPSQVLTAEPVKEPEPMVAPEPTSLSKVVSKSADTEDQKKSIVDSFVRVNVNILDKIMNVVGELVLNRNQILQYASRKDDSEFNRLSQQLNVITSELQSEVMSTRMQPIGNVLNKFERLVRDIARSNDKKINLKLQGQETELDKSLIEAIKDPLVHIIRNSCDHGIEGLAERKSVGKSELGQVTIRAYNESGQVTIEISDDGRGLDPEKIASKAIEKGIISQEKLVTMSESQVLNLIFKPGFSTAEKVTNISGRGVGMDVVKTNIEKIGGTVSVASNLGEGTVFKLRIPLTLAIVPSLMIKSNKETFAIPQLNLVELVRLETEDELGLIESFSGCEFLRLRGKLTPIFRLGKELNLDDVHEKSVELAKVIENAGGNPVAQTHAHSQGLKDDSVNIVILNAEENFFGIVVDEILDTEEIVVKPLNNSLKEINIFGGATIMGDGSVALILDAMGFLSEVSQQDIQKHEAASDYNDTQNAVNMAEYQENLLFRLYDDRVYALPLQLVSRLEEVNVGKIERTGKQKVIRYLDAPMPLISVESILGLEGTSELDDYKTLSKESLSCVVTNVSGRNFGIIVKEVLDISIDNVSIDDTAIDRNGILGTIYINEQTVPLLDLYGVLSAQNLGVVKKLVTKEVRQKKILLVDDSPMYRKMESDALLELGYNVTTANHGQEGFEMLAAGDYDLLITDIEMPHLNGFEFAKKVRTELADKDVPIIALSTRFSNADKEHGKECGFSYHLEKFKKDEVLQLVNDILEGKNNGSSSTAS